jgi:hypothetical protein
MFEAVNLAKARDKNEKQLPKWLIEVQKNKAFFILDENNFIRRTAQYLISSKPVDIFLLLTIIANCIALALEDHLPNDDKTKRVIWLVSLFLK